MNHKFRVWVEDDDGEGRMIYLEPTASRYDFEDGYVLSFVEDGYSDFGSHERYKLRDKLTFMLWSGLKDKNGKEIYEGDVVEKMMDHKDHEWHGRHFIKFHSGQFGLIGGNPNGFRTGEIMNWYPHTVEVVGNIYENKEFIWPANW